jgi:RHH-type rel operon transcriptional repressor/antitoxin RelB
LYTGKYIGVRDYFAINESYTEHAMPISIRLPEEIEHRLNELAARTGRSKTFYATEAILEHLDDLEDLYLAEQSLIEVRAGRSETIPLEEVMRQYGIES